MTKPVDLRAKTKDELRAMLLDLRKEQFNLRFQSATAQLGNTARLRVLRKDIARIMTLEAQAKDVKAAPKPKAAKKTTTKKTGTKAA